MAVAVKTSTMMVECGSCNCKNEISAKDLTKSGQNYLGGSRYLTFVCKKCGCSNTLFAKEVSIHILRELNEM